MSSQPIVLYRGVVRPDWVDANGHLNDGYYAVAFGEATWNFQDDVLVMDADYRSRTRCTMYTAEAHIIYKREVMEGQALEVTCQVLGADAKRVHIFHRMVASGDEYIAATMELMLLHVDQSQGRVTPFAPEVSATLEDVAKEHAALAWPEEAGRCVRRLTAEG